MKILLSVSALNKQAVKRKAIKKPAKKVKIPASVEFAATQSKSRVISASPGRYILKNRKGTFALVKFSEDTKYTPSMKTKMFSASSSESSTLVAESAGPGSRASIGSKLGKKTHAKGMLAAGWWLFSKDSKGNAGREYVGGRLSARRLAGLLKGEKPTNEEKPSKKDSGKDKANRTTVNKKQETKKIS